MARSVFAILDEIGSSVSELKGALAPLASLMGHDRPSAWQAPNKARAPRRRRSKARARRTRPTAAERKTRRARKPISAAQKAQRVLQGRYLGAMRKLTKAQRENVKKIRAAKGHEAAIKFAATL
jgi:hypothetical protein